MATKIWYCKIGEIDENDFEEMFGQRPKDPPMRAAIAKAYKEITGKEPDFLFSGWGAELTEPERAVVEDRMPDGRLC